MTTVFMPVLSVPTAVVLHELDSAWYWVAMSRSGVDEPAAAPAPPT